MKLHMYQFSSRFQGLNHIVWSILRRLFKMIPFLLEHVTCSSKYEVRQLTMSLNWKSISNLTWSCELLVPGNHKPHWIHLANRCEFGRYPAWCWGTVWYLCAVLSGRNHQRKTSATSVTSTEALSFPQQYTSYAVPMINGGWSARAASLSMLMNEAAEASATLHQVLSSLYTNTVNHYPLFTGIQIQTSQPNSMEFRLRESSLRLRSHLRSGHHSQNDSLPVQCVQSEDSRNPNRFV